ncbi:protein ZNF365 [Microtus ochrogaster]|uniref:Protein ZNF365 n=1 Tax=Microtus ochrogaster TaxID=79684 RepID=A0ABM0L6Z5_MICOH|nr:protein ZNF365 [Microtus ochrogaster]
MQQTTFEESRYRWQDSLENVAVCLPFRCPRCGDHTRFRSLSSLRAHLEFSHSYEERTLLTKCSLLPSLKDTELVRCEELPKQGKLLRGHAKVTKQKPSYVNLYSISHGHSKDPKPFEMVAERPVSYVQTYTAVDIRADSLEAPRSSPGLPTPDTKTAFEAHVREKFNRMVEAVDRTIEKRIDKLTKELAQKTAELLEVRAAFVQLTQKKQEVQRRERALNRQVDVAVEMIAVLKQRLTESEEELLRKEEEVVTFNHFLEAAAEKEVQGKARLQDFIENLLQRVELAEKQLEYYQSQQASGFSRDASEHVLTDISSNRKPRCLIRGHPHSVCNHPELRAHFHLRGRSYLKKVKDERAGMQPAKAIHEQAESPREFFRPAKKGEHLGLSRKGNFRPKMVKKKPTAIVNII